ERFFPCIFCGKIFRHQPSLSRHVSAKHRAYRSTCPKCGQIFSHTKAMAEHHTLYEDGILKYRCSYCDKVLLHSASIQRHIKEKHYQVKYDCPNCGKSFSQKNYVTRHLK
ncbi:hypothetical protein LOTGIDRAFT_76581, partial [Lottia gigantea]